MVFKPHESLTETIRKIGTIVTLFLTLGSVVIGLFNYLLLNRVQPLDARISAVEHTQTSLATRDQIISLSLQIQDLSSYVHTLVERGLR